MGLLKRLFGGDSSHDLLGNPALTKALKLTSEGNYYGGQGNMDRAKKCFTKAIAAEPDHGELQRYFPS